MRNLSVLITALEVIEKNLTERFTVEDLARECYVSVSGLQKMFNYVFGFSVGEYMLKRRLSAATYELVNTNKSITDIALTYRYTSPEAFSRSFKNFWGVLPSTFRKQYRFSELFPKLEPNLENGGDNMSNRRKVDISELYDELKKLRGTYVLCTSGEGFLVFSLKLTINGRDAQTNLVNGFLIHICLKVQSCFFSRKVFIYFFVS